MAQCKICLEEITDLEDVYSPCNCRGHLNYIHVNCFNEAYIKQNKYKCEICKINFPYSNTIYISLNNTEINDNELHQRDIEDFQSNFYYVLKNTLFELIIKMLDLIFIFLFYFINANIIVTLIKKLI